MTRPILCPACRKLTPAEHDRCLGCGSELRPPETQKREYRQPVSPQPEAPAQYGPGTLIFVALIFLAVLVFIATLFINNRDVPAAAPVEIVSNSAWDGSVRQVETWLEQNLKDPNSFEAIEWGKVLKADSGNFLVRVKYRAKNSYGGYVIEEKLFELSPQGGVLDATDRGR